MTTDELQAMAEGCRVFSHKDGLALAAEVIALRARVAAADALAEAAADFANAKIDALRFPGVIRSPEDEPDPVVEADYVWSLQEDVKSAISAYEAAK